MDASGKTVPVMQLAGQQEGWASQHQGLVAVRRRRQPLTQSPRSLSSGCSPGPVEVQELAAASHGKLDNKVTLKRAVQSSPPSTGSTTRRCCTLRPSYGFIPKAKQGDEVGGRCCSTPTAEGTEELRNCMCTHVDRRGAPCCAQPSYSAKATSAARDSARMPREPNRMSSHQGATWCDGGREICVKRPSYGFWEDPRPTRCSSHKETEMVDLISARCNFAGCRTVASYGVQFPGSHVIRRTRCKAHGTPEMTSATKGPPCRAPGGCKTRPSYGWPDKLDGEHRPRPERCKKHLLLAMEYMGSNARAKKKRQLETVKQAPVMERPPHPDTYRPSAKPFYLGPKPKRTPWLHPTCECTAAAALILEPDLGDIEEMDAPEDPPEAAARASSPEGCMHRSPEAGRTSLAAAKSSRLTEEWLTEGWRMQRAELEKLGDQRVLQELKDMEDSADDRMGLFIRSRSPELAGMSEFDEDFSSSWGRLDSPEIEAILHTANDTLDSV